jgi:hypothetical protein
MLMCKKHISLYDREDKNETHENTVFYLILLTDILSFIAFIF